MLTLFYFLSNILYAGLLILIVYFYIVVLFCTYFFHHRAQLNNLIAHGQVDEDFVEKKKRRRQSSRRIKFEVRSVDDITQEDLDNIAGCSKDKIWDKENVSHLRRLPISWPWYCVLLSGFLV